jgi:hypothetical protein
MSISDKTLAFLSEPSFMVGDEDFVWVEFWGDGIWLYEATNHVTVTATKYFADLEGVNLHYRSSRIPCEDAAVREWWRQQVCQGASGGQDTKGLPSHDYRS